MTIELKASARQEQGTSASRRLRRAGVLPGVVYGANKSAQPIALEHKVIYYALRNECFHSDVLSLDIDGVTEQVILRDYQMHPYKQQVLHVDFQRIDPEQKIQVKVVLNFLHADICPAVKLQGGKINQVVSSVEVRALPKYLPRSIDVDLSHLKAGHSVHLSDLVLPEGVELLALTRGENLTLVTVSGAKKTAGEDL
jgi:large subunit ribosomal protein L25